MPEWFSADEVDKLKKEAKQEGKKEAQQESNDEKVDSFNTNEKSDGDERDGDNLFETMIKQE